MKIGIPKEIKQQAVPFMSKPEVVKAQDFPMLRTRRWERRCLKARKPFTVRQI